MENQPGLKGSSGEREEGNTILRVNIQRVDVWRRGEEVRTLTTDEREMLESLREAVRSGEVFQVPSLKCV